MSRRPLANLLTATTTTLPAVTTPLPRVVGPLSPSPAGPQPVTGPRVSMTRTRPGRFYLALAALALALAALSLLFPSTPSYDPWSWSLWGREIVHGHLTITTTGTSFKPLPMIFTIPFALAGSAAPDLWLVVARAGALAAVVMVFRLAYRLTRALADPSVHGTRIGALAGRSPAALAGVIAAVGLALSAGSGFISSSALGYSEGLTAALLLVAIECHLDGRPRHAFLVGFVVALDRPETWLFWVPYGLWLFRRDPRMRTTIAIAFALQPVVWFLPVYLGSGHFGSSVTRAQHPRANSLAFASSPFLAELRTAAWPTMLLRLKVPAALLVIGVATALARRARAGRAAPAAEAHAAEARGVDAPRMRALSASALMGLGGLAWFLVIAVMTQLGFSGNDRYLVLGSALVDVAGAVAFGWLAIELGAAASALRSRRAAGARAGRIRAARSRSLHGRFALVGAVAAAAVFSVVPNWVGRGAFVSLPALHGSLLYQAHLRQGLDRIIARYGGPRKVLGCGSVMTEGFQVPMVAWALNVPTVRVLGPPPAGAAPGPAPNLILQTRDTRSAALLPIVHSWPRVHYTYQGTEGPFRMFTQCQTSS